MQFQIFNNTHTNHTPHAFAWGVLLRPDAEYDIIQAIEDARRCSKHPWRGQAVKELDMGSIPQTSGIYQILCIPTGKVYIGSAIRLRSRRNQHFNVLRSGRHTNVYLQSAWDKYGESAFEFRVVELVLVSFLIEREQYWLDKLRSYDRERGFNLSPTAGSPLGVKRSEETRRKQSALKIGRKRGPQSEEHRRNISLSQKGRKRGPIPQGQREKRRGWKNPHSPETIEKMRTAMLGRPPSEQTIVAVVAANSKTYLLVTPDGDELIVTNLSRFCRENGLLREVMNRVLQGRQKHHKGWTCRRLP